jgi:hypothetical protein
MFEQFGSRRGPIVREAQARKFFEQSVNSGAEGPRLQAALVALVELILIWPTHAGRGIHPAGERSDRGLVINGQTMQDCRL